MSSIREKDICDFIDAFNYDPVSAGSTELRLRNRQLTVVDNSDVSLLDALWSAIQSLPQARLRWGLAQATAADFEERLRDRLDRDPFDTYHLLRATASELSVEIRLFSLFFPLVPDTLILPRGRHRSSGTACELAVLHTGRSSFRGLISAAAGVVPRFTFPADAPELPEDMHMSRDMKSLIRQVAALKPRTDDEGWHCDNDQTKEPQYKVLSREELEDKLKTQPEKYRRCVLHLQGPHEGAAEVIGEGLKETVVLRGRPNCGLAFEGDEVVVELRSDPLSGAHSGQVVGVWSSTVRPVNQVFFCRVSRDQTTLMRPICGTVPKIHVFNEVGENEYEANMMRDEQRLLNFGLRHGGHHLQQPRRASRRHADQYMVSLYNFSVNKNGRVTFKPKEAVRIDRLTCEAIFVVVYQHWSPICLYPCGHVVGILPPQRSFGDELALLRLQFGLPHPLEEAQAVSLSAPVRKRHKKLNQDKKQRRDFRRVTETFTIDGEGTEDMDDAISVRALGADVLEVAVHVTDVAHFVAAGSALDVSARSRTTSVYAGRDAPAVHMFPPELATELLSLRAGQERLCQSVILRFKKSVLLPARDEDFVASVIVVSRNLTKREASAAIRDEQGLHLPQNLVLRLQQLFQCILRMREERLGSAAFCDDHPSADIAKVGAKFEAHILIEELMVTANQRVAELLRSRCPLAMILLKNAAPNPAEVNDWMEKHAASLPQSRLLLQQVRAMELQLPPRDYGRALTVSWDVKSQLEVLRRAGRVDGASRLLLAEPLHPHLLLALQDLAGLTAISSYGRFEPEKGEAGARHFRLGCRFYTHFTSPLRRYCDLVIHRLLSAVLRGQLPHLPPDELREALAACNARLSQTRRYKKALKMLKLFRQTQRRALSLPCVIADLTPSHVTLKHHAVGQLSPSLRRISLAQLNPTAHRLTAEGLICDWRERLFCFGEAHSHARRSEYRASAFPTSFELRVFEKQALVTAPGKEEPPVLPNCSPREMRQLVTHMELMPLRTEIWKADDVTSEVIPTSAPAPRKLVLDTAVAFSSTFRIGECVRAQFSPAPTAGQMRSAAISLLQVCPSFSICLEHMSEPLHCFGDAVREVLPTCTRFPSIQNYCDLQLPILRVEAISEAISDANTFHVSDVPVTWFRARDNGRVQCGVVALPEAFCDDPYRQIDFRQEGSFADCLRPDCSFLNYLCLRIQVEENCFWVGHGGIKRIVLAKMEEEEKKNKKVDKAKEEKEHMFVLFFQLHPKCRPPPSDALSKPASMVFIAKTLPKRLEESAMKCLRFLGDCPTTRLALGQRAVRLNPPFLFELRANNFTSDSLFTADCNPAQRKAIVNAFSFDYSLIWGPPGTGKTVTGVQIAFWFVQFNRRQADDDSSDDSFFTASEGNEDEEEEEEAEPALTNAPLLFSFVRDGTLFLDFPEIPLKFKELKFKDLKKRRRQVLYCGPSNACVNCVAGHMREKLAGVSLVRVFNKLAEERDFPLPGVRSSARLDSEADVPQDLQAIALHRLVRQSDRPLARLLQLFDEGFDLATRFLEGNGGAQNAVVTIAGRRPGRRRTEDRVGVLDALHAVIKVYRKLLACAKGLELRQHDVVLSTIAGAASKGVQNNCRFCQVIVDEAGMCTEAQTLLPLVPTSRPSHCSASAAIERVILIGDHKQLRPIVKDQTASQLGLERSMLERHWGRGDENCVMLKEQFRMHPTICEFISKSVYAGKLRTALSSTWTGLDLEHIPEERRQDWTGFNAAEVGGHSCVQIMRNANANVLEFTWPGVNREGFLTFDSPLLDALGVEERVMFLHVEGQEDNLFVSSAEGGENSKANLTEAKEVVRIYMEMRERFAQPRSALASIAVLSQYQHQVHLIRDRLTEELNRRARAGRVARLFRENNNTFRAKPSPLVTTVVRSQGSEFDYVILSTVRTLPAFDINHRPTPGWEKKYLGFITDVNQVNVALTRARKGLIIVGNGNLLRVHEFWRDFIADLQRRGCYVENSFTFSCLERENLFHDPR